MGKMGRGEGESISSDRAGMSSGGQRRAGLPRRGVKVRSGGPAVRLWSAGARAALGVRGQADTRSKGEWGVRMGLLEMDGTFGC